MGGHNAGADLDQLCEPADHTKVPLSPVYAEYRDIDTEPVDVVSAIALDETSSQEEIKS